MGEGTCKAACVAQGTMAGEILSLSLSLKSGRRVCRKDLRRAGNCIGICREMKNNLEEGDVMDWLEDDEMMKEWEEVSKDEETFL